MVNSAALLLAVAGAASANVVKRAPTSATAAATGTVAGAGTVGSATSSSAASTTIPDYFEVTPRIFDGPTSSGAAPFLAQTNPAPFSQATFVAASPLETSYPIVGNNGSDNIFHYMGQLSHYFPNPSGFGINEMPLPAGANITWVNMLARHGSRYPTSNSSQEKAGRSVVAAVKNGTSFTGALGFLNTWQYVLGYEVLVPVGKQELFDNGILHFYKYGHLWNRSQPLVLRTTTEERMRQSAENFAAGFGGDINWKSQNIEIEYIIEQDNFNNTLAGYDNCNQSNANASYVGSTASNQWVNIYLQNATARFQNMTNGSFKWTPSTVYGVQGLCPYETVALGYSAWCDLFTFEEWQGFEYSIDISFAGNDMFQGPSSRGVGVGYTQEVLARLNHHYLNQSTTQANTTLDSMASTFPLNQTLYFDFSHDTNIASILTAFNFTQFQPLLNQTKIQSDRSLIVSHMTPFGARLDIEIINAPRPVSPTRTGVQDAYTCSGTNSTSDSARPTKYIHFVLNQRTLPLYPGYPACGQRTDGWCELETFLNSAKGLLSAAQYDYSCNGNYSSVPYGAINNGVPLKSS